MDDIVLRHSNKLTASFIPFIICNISLIVMLLLLACACNTCSQRMFKYDSHKKTLQKAPALLEIKQIEKDKYEPRHAKLYLSNKLTDKV